MSLDKEIRDYRGKVYQRIISGDILAIMYMYEPSDPENTIVLHKIGTKSNIDTYRSKAGEKIKAMEKIGVKFETLEVIADEIGQEEVDKLFQITGYLKRFLFDKNLLPMKESVNV